MRALGQRARIRAFETHLIYRYFRVAYGIANNDLEQQKVTERERARL